MPGFTPISMYPKLWQAAGLSLPRADRPARRAGPRAPRPPPPQHQALIRHSIGVTAPSAARRKAPQLGAQLAQAGGVRRPADGAQRLGLGGDAGDGAVGAGRRRGGGRRGAGGRRPSRRRGSRRHARRAGRRGACRRVAWAGGSRLSSRTRPSSAGRRTARRNTAVTTASIRASGSSGAARTAASMTTASSAAVASSTAVDELVLAREPVQDGLLADADLGRDLVERDGVDATDPEAAGGRVQDAVAGRHDAISPPAGAASDPRAGPCRGSSDRGRRPCARRRA